MNIGLIADDSRKKLMQNFCIACRSVLSKNTLFATETTGRVIEEVTNLEVNKLLAGHLGGVAQLTSQVDHNLIDVIIYLRDPNKKTTSFSDESLFSLCDLKNIPVATNLATAELIIKALERGDLMWRELYKL